MTYGMNSKTLIFGATLTALCGILLLSGCYRGRPSTKPPINTVKDMDHQPKYEPMESSDFFANGAAVRVPPAGTVPSGWLGDNTEYSLGRTADGQLVQRMPVQVTMPLLQRGQERFNIYCSPCHSRVGDGQGIVVKRGYLPPPTFHDERLRTVADGHIFDVITRGVRNMPSYAHQIPVDDRWAIVAYFRALQRSRNAAAGDVPAEVLRELKP